MQLTFLSTLGNAPAQSKPT